MFDGIKSQFVSYTDVLNYFHRDVTASSRVSVQQHESEEVDSFESFVNSQDGRNKLQLLSVLDDGS